MGELYGRKNKIFDDKYLTSFWSQGAVPARGTRNEGGGGGGGGKEGEKEEKLKARSRVTHIVKERERETGSRI